MNFLTEVINMIHQLAMACYKYKGKVFTDKDSNVINDENEDTEDNAENTEVDEECSPTEEIEENYSPPEEIYSRWRISMAHQNTNKKIPSSQEWQRIMPTNTKTTMKFRVTSKNITIRSILPMMTST